MFPRFALLFENKSVTANPGNRVLSIKNKGCAGLCQTGRFEFFSKIPHQPSLVKGRISLPVTEWFRNPVLFSCELPFSNGILFLYAGNSL
jgi:hypothetical protein